MPSVVPYIGDRSLQASSLAQAIARVKRDGDIVSTQYHTAPGDGGGGTYVYKTSGRQVYDADKVYPSVPGSGADDYLELVDTKVLTPQALGIPLDGTDQGANFQKFLNLIASEEYPSVRIHGTLGTSIPLQWTGTSTASLNIDINLRINALASMTDPLLTIEDFTSGTGRHLKMPGGSLRLYGTGGFTYSTRTCRTGLKIVNSNRALFEDLECYNFSQYGILADSDGASNNSLQTFGNLRITDCGGGNPFSAGENATTWSNRVNSGSASSTGQYTTVDVAADPISDVNSSLVDSPKYAIVFVKTVDVTSINTSTDTITATGHGLANGDMVWITSTGTAPGGTGNTGDSSYFVVNATTDTLQLRANEASGILNITSTGTGTVSLHKGTLHNVVAVRAGKVDLYPWVITSESTGKICFHNGAGLAIRGNDSANCSIRQLDALRCSVAFDWGGAYGPQASRIVSQANTIGISLGRHKAGASVSGEILNPYFETCIYDIVKLSTAVTGYTFSSIQPIAYSRIKSIAPVSALGVENPSLVKLVGVAIIDGRIRQTTPNVPFGGAGSTTTLTLGDLPAIVRLNTATISLKDAPDQSRLFATNEVRVTILGSGANNTPTGTITFVAESGYTINGGASYAITMDRPSEFCCFLQGKSWYVFATSGNVFTGA